MLFEECVGLLGEWKELETKCWDGSNDRRHSLFFVKRFQQEKLKCERIFNVICEIKEEDRCIKFKYGSFESRKIDELVNHFNYVAMTERDPISIDRTLDESLFGKFLEKTYLMEKEKEYKISIHIIKNEKNRICATGATENIKNFSSHLEIEAINHVNGIKGSHVVIPKKLLDFYIEKFGNMKISDDEVDMN